jgi:hypothetical protein
VLLFKNILILYFLLFFNLVAFCRKNPTVNFLTNEDTSSIFLYAIIDNEVSLFLFDNASQKTVLFVNSKYNLDGAKKINLFDSDDNQSEAYIKSKEVKIQNLGIHYKGSIIIMKNTPILFQEQNIKGIIGADIINKYDWDIDLKSLKISKLNRNAKFNENFFVVETYIDKSNIISTDLILEKERLSFQLDLGYNSIISTALTENVVNNLRYKKYSFGYSISSQKTLDTTYMGIESINIGNILVNNIPINFSKIAKSNLLGVSFFKPFGRIILLNSTKKMLLPLREVFIFKIDTVKRKRGEIVSQIIPLNENSPCLLGRSDVNNQNPKAVQLFLAVKYFKTN